MDIRDITQSHENMNRPVLYFTLGMLMHIPIISQPTDRDKCDSKMGYLTEYHLGDEFPPKASPITQSQPRVFTTGKILIPDQ